MIHRLPKREQGKKKKWNQMKHTKRDRLKKRLAHRNVETED